MNQEQIKALSIREGVNFMNNTFGNKPLTTLNGEYTFNEAYWSKMLKQAAIVKEEVGEMIHGIELSDRRETRDGVCDTLVTGFGLVHIGNLEYHEMDREACDISSDGIDSIKKEIEDSFKLIESAIQSENPRMLSFATEALLFETFSIAKALDIDIEADMYAVLVSNLSKVSKTQGDALVTQQYYRESVGIETRLEDCPTMPGFIIKVQGNQSGKDGKNYPDGKFLKCRVGFQAPQFN